MVRSTKRKKSNAPSLEIQKENINTSSKKKKKSLLPPDDKVEASIFKQLVSDSGFGFAEVNKEPNELYVDQVQFQRKLTVALKTHPTYPDVIQEFILGLQNYWEDLYRFCFTLLPTTTSDECEVSSRGKQQDSLIRILLGIEIIQPAVAQCLLEKLPELCMDDDLPNVSLQLGDIDIPHHAIGQLRWLDKVKNSKDLVEKILEVVTVSDVSIQRELIACIPDVTDDVHHAEVARQLKTMLIENSELTTSLLDALSNMNLKGDVLTEIRTSVINILNSASLEDLPVVIKFIQQSIQEKDAFEVVCELQAKLDFSSSMSPYDSSTPFDRQPHRSSTTEKNHHAMVLDAIKCGVRFQRHVADGWMKAIEVVNTSSKHKVTDIFVLLVLHGIASRKKSVEALFRNKIKSGLFTEELLVAAVHSHAEVLYDYFGDIIALAECFLRSPEISVADYGCNIYKQAFINFGTYCQQEVVGALVTHVGSGYSAEIESALHVLKTLVQKHPTKMKPFTIFLKGILDYLDNLSISQIRCLFFMLSSLTYEANSDDDDDQSLPQDDMYIVVRKQLASSLLKYKRIGIIGAVMIVGSMARRKPGVDSEEFVSTEEAATSLSSSTCKQIVSLLELIKSSVKKTHLASGLFYDELAGIVAEGNLDKKILHWITESVVADFQNEYLVDIDVVKNSKDKQLSLAYDLDDAEEGGISVNILPIIIDSIENDGPGSSSSTSKLCNNKLICLPSHFRLLRICEQKKNGGKLDEVDALLGCPLVLFGNDVMEKFASMKEQDKQVVCSSLLYAINWLRELLNAFSTQEDAETRGKMIARVETMTSMSTLLEKCLTATPNFEMPVMHFDLEESLLEIIGKPIGATMPSEKEKKPKKKKAKKKQRISEDGSVLDNEDDDSDQEDDDDGESVTSDKSDDKKDNSISLSSFRGSFRELDMTVFNVLTYGSVSKAYVDSEMNTKTSEVLELKSPQLASLLEDLERKLEHSLTSSQVSRRTFLKQSASKLIGFSRLNQISAQEIIEAIIKILPAILDILENTMNYFQNLDDDDSDILVDFNSEEYTTMTICYQSLMHCLQLLFTWHGFNGTSYKGLLKKALSILSKRVSTSGPSGKSTDLMKHSFNYLSKFSKTLPGIQSAVHLGKMLMSINKRRECKEQKKMLSNVIDEFLKKDWTKNGSSSVKGTKFNEAVSYLFRMKISLSDNILEEMESWCQEPFAELAMLDGKADQGTKCYATLTRGTFSHYYRGLFDELINYAKVEFTNAIKSSDPYEEVEQQLLAIHKSIKLFQTLIGLVKEFDTKPVFSASLKFSRLFLETFLRSAMPLLDKTLRSHKDVVHATLKSVQQSTRSLQHLCGHSKVLKDVSLTSFVPGLKKSLEQFVFRVKAMLAFNHCDSAFWLGNLKNRDLQGNEILSQASQPVDTPNDDDDEEDEEQEANPTEGVGNEVDDEEEDESYSESY